MSLHELRAKLKEKTQEMMNVPRHQSHKRARLFYEMQDLFREIKKFETR